MSKVYTSPVALAMAQAETFRRVGRKHHQLHDQVAFFGKDDFFDVTDGPLKQDDLDEAGNPYARLRTRVPGAARGVTDKGRAARLRGRAMKGQVTKQGQVKRLPINIQSGALRRGITLAGPQGNARAWKLYSSAPHARFALAIKGTKYVVPRGVKGKDGVLSKRHKARMQVILRKVIQEQQK